MFRDIILGMTRKHKTPENLIGQNFYDLIVVKFAGWSKLKNRCLWECFCKCGKVTIVNANSLKTGNTKSCGCRLKHHGLYKTPEYEAWASIKKRCLCTTHHAYDRYGGRGIKICSRWIKSFENFLKDMGKRPSADQSIDRFPNPNGNYEPSNCRWATRTQQQRNRKDTKMLTHEGTTLSLPDWAERKGIDRDLLGNRIRKGWTVARALETPA